jgi:hypothetical protein
VPDHMLILLSGALMAAAAAVVAALATRVQLLPEVIDISFIPTGSGVASLAFVTYGALRRYEPDRLGRLALLGTLLGGLATAASLLIFAVADVSPSTMWRALAPYLAVYLLIMSGAGVAYSRGAPAWVAYAALLVATVAVLLPGIARWEERQHHR